MNAYYYNQRFMGYAARSSLRSAQAITSLLYAMLIPKSVLDIGCALGTWLRCWSKLGVADFHGVDGSYVDQSSLEIPVSSFTSVDLDESFNLGRQFDLVQSLEVGEHIKNSESDKFVQSITRHAKRFALFSAAPPGQCGENHINEQKYEFWRERFAQHEFAVLDCVRPLIKHEKAISYWYRYNTFLYVRRDILDSLDQSLRDWEVPNEIRLRDVSPVLFRFRKSILRQLPKSIQNESARLKARVAPTGRI
jgi:hypothetical protein